MKPAQMHGSCHAARAEDFCGAGRHTHHDVRPLKHGGHIAWAHRPKVAARLHAAAAAATTTITSGRIAAVTTVAKVADQVYFN